MALVPAIYQSSTDQAFFTLLTFQPADNSAPIRFVNNLEAVVSRGNTFQPFPFSIKLLTDDGESNPQVTLQIDATDQQVIELVRELQEPPMVTLEIVLSGSPNTVDKSVDFLRMLSVSYDALTVTVTLQPDNFLNLPAVDSIYSGNEFPDLVT
jgi:Domain of unknown function (DUF1833)